MKTTIDISDWLLREARRIAAREGTTLRSLVEEGLRRVIGEKKSRPAFRLRKASFMGRGLREELRGVRWERVRSVAYKGRGGR
jgi:Bacterial antitoxin of type II TA system, VapB